MPAEKGHSVIATVSSGGRLRIPKEVVEQLHLKDGQQIAFFLRTNRNDAALVAPVPNLIEPPDW
jgi:bifunctional DNA-binding transcriptional regulator/antitoxin component of YhaV-PrlF toxin-antitoxin module